MPAVTTDIFSTVLGLLGLDHPDPKRPLDGAYPAVTYAEEGLLLSFYRDIESAFARVRRDGDEDRGRRRRR